MTRIANPILMAGSVAFLAAMPALASRISDQPVQGWSAHRDMAPVQLLERADDMPSGDMIASDAPFCASDAEIRATLRNDFNEAPIDSHGQEVAQLWGSQQMGTWTLVAERSDQTSCIIASGIGFDPERKAEVYFETAGLTH